MAQLRWYIDLRAKLQVQNKELPGEGDLAKRTLEAEQRLYTTQIHDHLEPE